MVWFKAYLDDQNKLILGVNDSDLHFHRFVITREHLERFIREAQAVLDHLKG